MAFHPLIALVAQASACPSVDDALERATQAIVSGESHQAALALTDADTALACAPASPTQAGRYFLVTGALRNIGGQDALPHFAASRRVAPDGFDARFGPAMRAAFDASRDGAAATLLLEPMLPAAVDGARVEVWPTTIPSGPHVVQVVGREGNVRFYRSLSLTPGEDALVPTGLTAETPIEEPAALPAEPVVEPEPKKGPAFLIAAAVVAAGGGAMAAGAGAQTERMRTAGTTGDVEAAHDRQVGFAAGAYGLWGLAAAGVVVHFVVK